MDVEVPAPLKHLKPYVTLSKQFLKRDPVVAYYVKLYVIQEGMLERTDPSCKLFLISRMDSVEALKSQLKEDEAVINEVVGQAYVEKVAMKLFTFADNQDRAANFNKEMVKSFVTSAFLFTTLKQFGEQTDEVIEKLKYAKWKAAEITRCLKAGITPTPGPPGGMEEEEEEEEPGAVGFSYAPGGDDGWAGAGTDPPAKPVPKPRHNQQPPNDGPSYPPGAPTSTYLSEPSYPPGAPTLSGPSSGVSPSSSASLDGDVVAKAIKQTKYATSSLNFNDVPSAIEYLEKALALLKP